VSQAPEVSKPSWLSLTGVGLAGGLFAGVFGVGGGIIMVSLLMRWAQLDQKRAHATSLLAITPVAAIGSVSYAVGGVFAWLPAIFVAIGGIFGAQIGAWLLRQISLDILRWAFIAFIIVSGILLLSQLPDRSAILVISTTSAMALFGLGIVMGIAAGLFGIGAGVIVVPVLMLFFGQSDLVAKSISLLAMAPGAISGSISHLRHKSATLRDGAWVAAGSLITTPIGAVIAFLLSPSLAALLFGLLMFVVATNLIVRALRQRGKN
jgi:uncharacterized membrane protein YfcA